MAAIILNPNSIYRNSQANFILNKDALYAFTRSISAVNNSIYGMQPTKEQLLSGFDLSDIFAVNPLSSNNSLCANVYVLDNSVNALKFFSSRPFVVLSSTTELDEKAQNPFAVYLTPIADSENRYEWIYIMPSIPEVSDWDLMLSAYSAWEADKEGFRLSSFGGKWELIGSTSFTDEEISALYNDIKSTIDEEVSTLNNKIDTEVSERKEADTQIIAEVDSKLSSLDEKLSAIEEISSVYETKADAADKLIEAKTYADNAVSSIREGIEEEIDNVVDGFNNFISDEYEVFKDFVQNDLVTDLNNEVQRATSAENEIKDNYLPLSGIDDLSSDILDASKNYTDSVLSNLSDTFDLSSYAKLSDITEVPTDLSAFTNSPGYLTAHQSLSNYYTKSEADNTFLTAHQDLTDYATKDYVQSEISDFATKEEVQEVEDKLSDYLPLSGGTVDYLNSNKYIRVGHPTEPDIIGTLPGGYLSPYVSIDGGTAIRSWLAEHAYFISNELDNHLQELFLGGFEYKLSDETVEFYIPYREKEGGTFATREWVSTKTNSELSNYLPLSGGELNGDLIVKRRDGGFTRILVTEGGINTSIHVGGMRIINPYDDVPPKPYRISSAIYYIDGIICEDRLGNTFEYNFPAISGSF